MEILASVSTVVLCGLTAAGFLAKLWWRFELASHFRAQYAALLLFCAAGLLLSGQAVAAAAAGLIAAVNLAVILPAYGRMSLPSAPVSGSLRLMLVNVNYKNRDYGRVMAAIRNSGADFVALIEITHAWQQALAALKDAYPYSQGTARRDGWGLLLLSRVPFEQSGTVGYRKRGVPHVTALLRIGRQRLRLLLAHSFSPTSAAYARGRNRQLDLLAKAAAKAEEPLLLVGDLNISPWSAYFRQLLRDSGLRDSRLGFGLQPTWPTWSRFLFIPIDHALVSSRIHVHNRQTGPAVGSDHLPVVMDFSIAPAV